MATNLTASQITKWKNSVDTAVTGNLIASLKKIAESAKNLKSVTDSGATDKDNLSYRFNDLAGLSTEAAKQLKTFMTSFDSSLEEYVNTVKKAEADATASMRKSLDQFAESAEKISKLKM